MKLCLALADFVGLLLVEDLRVAELESGGLGKLVNHLADDGVLLLLLRFALEQFVGDFLGLGLEAVGAVEARLLLQLHLLVLRGESLLELLHAVAVGRLLSRAFDNAAGLLG